MTAILEKINNMGIVTKLMEKCCHQLLCKANNIN